MRCSCGRLSSERAPLADMLRDAIKLASSPSEASREIGINSMHRVARLLDGECPQCVYGFSKEAA